MNSLSATIPIRQSNVEEDPSLDFQSTFISLDSQDPPVVSAAVTDTQSIQVPISVPSSNASQTLASEISSGMSNCHIFLDICCGLTRPLSQALLAKGCDVLSIDLLLDRSHDLLDASIFELVLKLTASGKVSYCAASPPCRDYSRLKLRPGGPPALRTPTHLGGLPGLN